MDAGVAGASPPSESGEATCDKGLAFESRGRWGGGPALAASGAEVLVAIHPSEEPAWGFPVALTDEPSEWDSSLDDNSPTKANEALSPSRSLLEERPRSVPEEICCLRASSYPATSLSILLYDMLYSFLIICVGSEGAGEALRPVPGVV